MNKKIIAIATALTAGLLVTAAGCGESGAQTASENISTAADNFEVQRKITGLNTRTGEIVFFAEGRCSVSRENGDLVATCKHGEGDYRKHMYLDAADVFMSVTQLAPINVSEYHTRVIIKPQGIIPDLELMVQL
jgi:hypothetical protein